MGRIEKTVFISYRRANDWTALAVYKYLTTNGFDVFMDYRSTRSADFEKVIFENVRARAHFLVILSPSALERCRDTRDLMRREIEMAMDEGRNIVPLMMEGFDFANSTVKDVLTGKLSALSKCDGMHVYSEYFDAAMERLRMRFLNVALTDIRLHPLSMEAQEVVRAEQAAVSAAPPIVRGELEQQARPESARWRMRIPVLGQISSGLPIAIPASDFGYFGADQFIVVDISVIPKRERGKELFALVVAGDGLIDAMVNHGDIVALRPTQDAKNGDMVAIWLPDKNETALKYYYKERDGFRLESANPHMKPIMLKNDAPLEIKGKVVMVIRKVEQGS